MGNSSFGLLVEQMLCLKENKTVRYVTDLVLAPITESESSFAMEVCYLFALKGAHYLGKYSDGLPKFHYHV